jgi:hypothetical protein
LITQEKKKTGEKLLRIVRSGRAPPPPPAAATARRRLPRISCFGAPHQGLARHLNHILSSPLRYRRIAVA